ncbi:MAG: serine/threonine-protein kinase [Phycisphaerae bacterium]
MSNQQTLAVSGYHVVQLLGSGARSTIWQVKNRADGEFAALKRVVKRQSTDQRFLEQAFNEYEIGRDLDHPNIRRIYELRRIKKWFAVKEIHLLMEYCEGHTLQDKRPKDVVTAARIFVKVGEALTYMNSQGIVHADMKPNNIVITPAGEVKVIDLGQSCPVGTVKKRVQGTPDFIAPEQVHRRPLDSRTDVFNFGASLYWTLTGRAIPTILPKKGAVTLMAEQSLTPPENHNPDVGAPLSKLVMDCVEPQPPHRPKSMKDVLARLTLITRSLINQNGNGTRPK